MELNKNKFQLIKKNNPFATKCCICGFLASGFTYYNVTCCDGCKHFFRRCVNSKELFKCKFDGNCDVMNVSIKCKSCRFDKCLLMGMDIQKLRGNQQDKSLWEIRSILEQRLGELALKGKYVEKRNGKFYNIREINFSFMQKIFIEKEESKIIEYLLLIEKNARRIRISPTKVTDKHYDFSHKTLNEVFNRKENLIFLSHEYLNEEQNFPAPDFLEFINKNGVYAMRPISLIEDLILIIDIAKIMPFFYKLEINDIIYQLTNISMTLVVLANVYYSCNKWSKTVMTADGLPIVLAFSGEYYKNDLTLNKFLQKIFTKELEPFIRVQINEEEYVLIRSIIYSHFVTNGLSKEGQKFLLSEAEKYSGILMKMLQKRYGQIVGARRYAELLHLIEFCFKCGNNLSLFFNYLANVLDPGRFEKVMPTPLIDLCLRCKNVKLPEITRI